MTLYGELDTANECMKRSTEMLESDWTSGKVRMRGKDIERGQKYLQDIKKCLNDISDLLKKFEGIATLENDGKI